MEVNEDEEVHILDISKPSVSRNTTIEDILLNIRKSASVQDEDFYATCTDDEQSLVNKFLDGEINFNEYIANVGNLNRNVDEPEIADIEASNDSSNEEEKNLGTSLKSRKVFRKLPTALKGLMGEANLRFVRGDKDTAIKICLEIIRQVPSAPEPFLTLASIYEEMGDQEKFLQMSIVAAHLSPTELYEWINLAEMSEKLGHIRQAADCYSKAINIDVVNIELHNKRAALLEKLGDKKTAIRGYMRLLSALKPEQGNIVLSNCRFVAELCHKENDIAKASSALDVAFEKCPDLITLEIVNLQLELLILLKNYFKCLDLMVKYCGLKIAVVNDVVTECNVLQDLPIEILANFIIILIHLKADLFFTKQLSVITDHDLSITGDVYVDIIEALMEECYYSEADKLLTTLVNSDSYNLPGVWLKYAENLRYLNRFEDSVRAFYTVLERVPQHVDARMTLGTLLVELGRVDEAIAAMTQNEENDYLHIGLLYERCMLLKQHPRRAQELIMVAQVLFSRHSLYIRNKDELSSISIIQRYDKKRNAVKQVRKTRKEPEEDCDLPSFKKDSRGPALEEEWELFKYVCNLCIKLKLFATFQRLTFTAMLSTTFHVYKYEIDLLSVLASYYNKDSHNGYNIIRTLVVKDPDNVKLWHLFNLIIHKCDDSRHHRFIMRQLARNCDHPALAILHGNNCLVSGTYKYAMHEYSSAFVKNPSTLGALLLGLTYVQMAAQKFTSKKHQLVIQALAHLNQYKNLRGEEGLQEVHYNLGRSFHHLGIFTQAVFHYKKVLELQDLYLSKNEPEIFDLSREAAFNLHLIYHQSESYDLAKMYLEKYIVV